MARTQTTGARPPQGAIGRALARVLVVLALLVSPLTPGLILLPAAEAIPPFPVADSGSGTTGTLDPNWTKSSASSAIGGTYTSDGWLRLTSASANQLLTMVNNTAFPSSSGFQVQFDYRMAGGAGHGLSFFLQDGAQTTIQSGFPGGGLGYSGGDGADTQNQCGVNGGFLGVGFDAYGNFSTTHPRNYGGTAALDPGKIVLRGSGAGGTGANCGSTGGTTAFYNFLGSAAPSGTVLTSTSGDPATSSTSTYRRARITLTPAAGSALTVKVELTPAALKSTSNPGTFTTVLEKTVTGGANGQVALPSTLKLGFGASTGSVVAYQDIRNVSAVGQADLALTKTADTSGASGPGGTYRAGDTVRYTLTATNNGPTELGPSASGYAKVYDPMASLPVKDVTWTCTAGTGASCLSAGGGGPGATVVDQQWVGGSGSSVTVNVTATATASSTATNTNTAVIPTWQSGGATANTVDGSTGLVQSDASLADANLSNNTASAPLTLAQPTVTLAKTLTAARANDADQFTLDVRTGSAAGPSVASATTTGTGATVATGSTPLYTAGAGGTVYLTEAMAAGSVSALDRYTGYLTCTDARGAATGLPTNLAFTGSYALTGLQAGTELSCVISNTPTSPTITLSTALGSIRLSAADQFQVQVRTDSASGPIVSSTADATTTGLGALVTLGSGTTGTYTATAGTTYYLTETKASGLSPIGLYTRLLTCVDLKGYQLGLPVAVSLGAGFPITPVAGAQISCTLINTADVTAPDPPVITAPANGSAIAASTPTVTGTAEAASTVRLYLDGSLVDSTTADAAGAFSWTPAALADGNHTVRATATDATGNTSAASATTTFTVDTVAPAAPVVTQPAAGAAVSTARPVYSGTAEANSSVAVIVDGTQIGTATADAAGLWSHTPAAALSDGPHTVRASASDAAGNTSPASNTVSFTVDTAAPAAPVVTAPADGSITSTKTPVVTGTAEAGSTVTVLLDGTAVGTAVADGSGAWTFSTLTPLGDGPHTVRATASDAAGNVSPSSPGSTFTLDSTAPLAPVITSPANGSASSATTPAYTGTAEPNVTLTVLVDGSAVGTTTATASGSWTFTQPSALADGPHTVRATASDAAGNLSPSSATRTFTVDTSAPAPPVLASPANGSVSALTKPTYSGTAEADSTVKVVVDGTQVASVTATAAGTWSWSTPTALADGTHTVMATATDAVGNLSANSNTNTFTVDTAAPAAPVVTAPANGSVGKNAKPTFSGTGEAGATLTVYVDGTAVGTATATGSGGWSLTAPSTLTDGTHTVRATATDAAGNTSGTSNTNSFRVDTAAPAAPVVTNPADGTSSSITKPTYAGTAEAGASVAIQVDGSLRASVTSNASGHWSWTAGIALADGLHTVRATATDTAGNVSAFSAVNGFTVDTTPPAAPVLSTPADDTLTNDSTPVFTGTGEPGATLIVSVDGVTIGTTVASLAGGSWSLRPALPLADGPHLARAVQQDAAGNTSPGSGINSFTVDGTAPDAPVVLDPADGSRTGDTTPAYTGTGEPGATLTVTVDGDNAGSTLVDPDGTWTLTPPTVLAEGEHTVSATQADPAGNASAVSNTHSFTVDTTPPPAPAISRPVQGSRGNDTTPSYDGTGEPGATLTLTVDGQEAGTVAVAVDGTWSLTPPDALADGEHWVTAAQRDVAGNPGPDSPMRTFTVDTTAPAAPVISVPAQGSRSNDTTPTYTGTGEPGATLTLSVDASVVASTLVADDGSWTLTPVDPLPEGSHSAAAAQRDAAGNPGPASASTTFVIDLTAPAAPVVTSPATGDRTSDTTPTYAGTGEPGASVLLTVDGAVIGTGAVAADGTWSLTPPTVLAEGSHTVSATQQDVAGNTGPRSVQRSFVVDTTPPPAPVLSTPAAGSRSNDTTPSYTGTGEPGATVTVSLDGTPVGTAVAAGGAWTLTPATPLTEGSHTVTATQRDVAGNTSEASAARSFTIDTTAPPAPVVTGPANGGLISDTTPGYTGTGEPGAALTVSVDGHPAGTVTVAADGGWQLAASGPALADGPHTVTATQTDVAGNLGPASTANTFTLDSTAPAAPSVTSPTNGRRINDNTPGYAGTGEPGATLTVRVDGAPAGSVVVAGDGSWTFTSPGVLADGAHTVTAAQRDPAGNSGPSSAAIGFTIDTAAPAAPLVTTPADGSVSNDTTPVYTGTGEPAATLTVTVDGAAAGSVLVAANGSWLLSAPTELAEGAHTVTATQRDVAGNTGPVSAATTFTIDTTAPAAPVISRPAAGSRGNGTSPVYVGTGEPGASLLVTVDGSTLVSTVVAMDGTWTVGSPLPLTEGSHTVTARQQDAAGNTGPAAPLTTFVIDITSPPPPAVTSPANGSLGNDNTPTYVGTGEPGATVTVTVDGRSAGTVVVAADGSWMLTQPDALPDGPHTVSATQQDVAGNGSLTPQEKTFTLDTVAPPAPVVATPADGSSTRDTTPAFSGTGEAGATLTVLLDGTAAGATTVAGDGHWTWSPTAPLAEGSHTVAAVQKDAAGNSSPVSATITFDVDTTAPAAPHVTTPPDGALTNDSTPLYSGTAEALSQVAVIVDGTTAATVQASPAGTWSWTPGTPLADGPHTVRASATDAAGNTSPASAANAFTVDTTAPARPVLASPADDAQTNDTTPTYSGTGEPGATVTVTVDGDPVGTATVAGDGSWTLTPATPLTEGPHTVSATQTDPAGNTGPASTPNTFTVDTTAPIPPAITAPASGAHTSDTTPTVTGTGERGATLTLLIDGHPAGATTVGGDGTWSVTPSSPLSDGPHTANATQTDPAGNLSSTSAGRTFIVDTAAPAAPQLINPADGWTTNDTTPPVTGTGEPGATLTVVLDGTTLGTTVVGPGGGWSFTPPGELSDGLHTVSATQTDAAGNTSPASATHTFRVDTSAAGAPVILTPADGAHLSDTSPTVSGTAEPAGTVAVSIDGTLVGTAVAGPAGAWSLPLTTPLAQGAHQAFATQTDAAGNNSPPSPITRFTVDTVAPAAPRVLSPADGSAGNDRTPTVTGTGEPGADLTVLIDGTPAGSTTVGADGGWTFVVGTPLSEGFHDLAARQSDPAGNISPDSAANRIEIDVTAPAAPVITAPANGARTPDTTPAVTGTGEPGARVTVRIDGAVAGTTTVDTHGEWTFTPAPLAEGPHHVAASQTDPAGNTSPTSPTITFTVDTTAPAAPAITAPADGSATHDTTPTVTGTGEPGATVLVTLDGASAGTAIVDGTGHWSLTLTTELSPGPHTVTATQTDAAGNTGPAATSTFAVDTTAPAPPTVSTPANGSATHDSTPTFTGTGEPGATVTVLLEGIALATTGVDASGDWTYTPTLPLAEGDYRVSARQADPAGNPSGVSATNRFTVDTTAPPTPVITGPAAGALLNDATPTFTGTGDPGNTVLISIDGVQAGTALVGSDGQWTWTPPAALPDGPHAATAAQADPGGNLSEVSPPHSFTIDASPPPAPVVNGPAPGPTGDNTPTITGTGEPGDTVTVLVDGVPIGTTVVGADGNWSLTPPSPLADGDHEIGATQTDPAGNPSQPGTPVPITVDTGTPAAPVITAPADGTLTRDATPAVIGTGEPGNTVHLSVDGRAIGSTRVGADGGWTFTSATPLADGRRAISATQTDPAGHTSQPAQTTVTIDTVALPPVITGPAPNATLTEAATPIITGTGEPGATVTVYIDGVALAHPAVPADGERGAPATVSADGTWTLTADPLALGSHTITARQSDPAGNVSGPSEAVRVQVLTAQETPTPTPTPSPSSGPTPTPSPSSSPTPSASPPTSTPTATTGRSWWRGGGNLARTGAEIGLATGIGLGLLGAGIVLTWVRRRRRH